VVLTKTQGTCEMRVSEPSLIFQFSSLLGKQRKKSLSMSVYLILFGEDAQVMVHSKKQLQALWRVRIDILPWLL